MIAVCSCQCGSSDNLIRGFLKTAGYQDWASIPIEKGKERSKAMLAYLPNFPEAEMLANFLEGTSKWAVIIGYDEYGMRWSDIAHNGPKSKIEAEFILEQFA